MSSASTVYQVGSEVLGYVGLTASWRRPVSGMVNARSGVYTPMLIISSAATTDEGVHEPAQTITIGSREGMIALRAAIDDALKEGTTP